MFPLVFFLPPSVQKSVNVASSLDIYAAYKSIYVDNLPLYVKVKLLFWCHSKC